MYCWVKSKAIPVDLKGQLEIAPNQPVCYVLRTKSLTDLMVLDFHCEASGIPRPYGTLSKVGDDNKAGTAVYLSKAGLLQKRRTKNIPTGLFHLIEKAEKESLDIQIVPVSVFWGRNPGKEEKSLFKLLFLDDEHGGFFQRFVTFFVQGRSVFCHFGQPVSAKNLIDEGAQTSDTTRKLRRVLKVHFRRQREMVLGPYIYDRRQIIERMLASKEIRQVVLAEAKKRRVPVAKVEAKARKYADEVCARISHPAIRFFDVLLSWLWKKIYDGIDVQNDERLRVLAEDYELVYMPSHRSHMDYLLIGYILYYSGLIPPHTIAGINLNFWPVGPLLRRGGGVFIRRSFSGDRLYGKVVSEFVKFLTTSGFPFCFYPEGGRSRTGLLLPPKMGILSMVVDSCRTSPRKPILLVPVWVGYDRLMEGRSYSKELRGKSKKTESIGGLLKASRIIRSKFGKAYINFGDPLDLDFYLKQHVPDWKKEEKTENEQGGQTLTPVVHKLAHEMMVRTNQAAMVSPVALFSLILLSTPKKALSETDLIKVAKLFIQLLREVPYHQDVKLPDAQRLQEALYESEALSCIERFKHPGGDVIYINESDSMSLRYYANNIMHLLTLPSLVAGFLQHNDSLDKEGLFQGCFEMYRFVCKEFFLHWQESSFRGLFDKTIQAMAESKHGALLQVNDLKVSRPEVMSQEFSYFKILGQITGSTIEKYALFGVLLTRYSPYGQVSRETFVKECELMSRRLGILNGMSDSLVFDPKSVRNFINMLMSMGYIQQQDEWLMLNKEMETCAKMFMDILSSDVRESIQRAPSGNELAQPIPKKRETKDEALASGQA